MLWHRKHMNSRERRGSIKVACSARLCTNFKSNTNTKQTQGVCCLPSLPPSSWAAAKQTQVCQTSSHPGWYMVLLTPYSWMHMHSKTCAPCRHSRAQRWVFMETIRWVLEIRPWICDVWARVSSSWQQQAKQWIHSDWARQCTKVESNTSTKHRMSAYHQALLQQLEHLHHTSKAVKC
jgi:hypothetical protein